MATVPPTRVWVAGEVVTDAFMNNNVSAVLNYLLTPPHFKGFQAVAQSVANSSFVALTYDSEVTDSVGGHSTVTNTSRYTAVYAGWYRKGGGCTFAANATGRRIHRSGINGAAVTASASSAPGNASILPWSFRYDEIFLNVADFAEDYVFQDTGAALSTFIANPEYQASMTLDWLSN